MDDTISRAEMLEALGHFNDYVNGDPHFLNGIETAKEIAENLPAVDAIPVEWLQDKMLNSPKELSISAWRVLNEWHPRKEAQK